MLDVWQDRQAAAACCRKGGNNNLCAIVDDDRENVEEATDKKEDLQAWCLLEDSENEQWQEVIRRRGKYKVKQANHASSVSVENIQNSEVKDRWVKRSESPWTFKLRAM